MISVLNRDGWRPVRMRSNAGIGSDKRVAVEHRLCQALLAIFMRCQYIMVELVSKRGCLPEYNQGAEQPGK